MTAEFLSETKQVTRQRNNNCFSIERKKYCQLKILYPAKVSFKNHVKTLSDIQKWKESILRDLYYK